MTQEFIVSILDDENDGDFSAGDLSLREAIALSNDAEGADTITFDSSLDGGTITLVKDQPTSRPTLANTPLLITDSVSISGLGIVNLTIDGDNGGNGIFDIDSAESQIDVTVENITIANGAQLAFSFSGLTERGGSFFVSDNASLLLKDSVITGSSASVGGAIYNRGTTTIDNSTIENNSSTGDGATSRPARTDGVIINRNELNVSDSFIQNNSGTGIFNIGTLEVENTSITNNTSIYAGGAIDNRNETTITSSNISGNSAPNGSAIRNTGNLSIMDGGSLTIDDTIIEGNISTSSDNNAIVNQQGTTSITNSTVTNHDGGSNVGIAVETGTLNVEGSTISNNRADQAQSGIIVSPEATANISNSTIANNEARSNGTVNLNNNTIANNTGGLGGGGIRNFGTTNIVSNIVANNGGGNLGDISGDGEVISGGNNLVGNANDVSGLSDTDITDVDPQLGELQDNGGTTQTLALPEDSPAIDAGSNPNGLTTDQRGEGFDRTVGDTTDIGAVEVQDVDYGGGEIPQELVVSTLEDENDGDFSAGDLSLREAIAIADAEDTITFDTDLSNNTISLTLGELLIDKDLTIQGQGANNLTIDGGSVLGESSDSIRSRVFNIDDNDENTLKNVTIEGLTITGGNQESVNENGGGILNQENLIVKNTVLENNFLNRGDGGGIANYGSLLLDSSLVSNNSSGFRSTGGGILNDGTAIVVNSTITGNSSFNPGGGISNYGSLTVENSTITQNDSGFFGDGISGSATITSSIVAGYQGIDLGISNITSGGNNLIGNAGDSTGLTDGENGDLVGTTDAPIDPLLGDLQNNGGTTPTVALLEGSPAIDAGSNPNNLTTDQRGEGFDRTVGDATDIGAFEVQDVDNGGGEIPQELVVSTLEDENDGDFSAGDLSLREAIAIANDTEGADTITFDSSLSGGTIALTETQADPRGLGTVNQNLLITDSVTISGLGANNLTIDGVSGGNGIFTVDGNFDNLTIDVVFEELTITNGTIERFFFNGGGSGGAIQVVNNANFTLVDSIVSNSSASGAGAISGGFQDVEIIGSLIANNGSGDPGFLGGAVTSLGNLTVINSTITNSTGLGLSSRGTLDISNSTITDGINANNDGTTLTSSIIVNNNTEGNDSSSITGQNITSGGNNLIGNGDNATGFIDSDLVGTEDSPIDPLLSALEDNGGNTPTIALLEDSPAINAGSNPNNLTSDQRGAGFDRTVGDATDIGAFEVQDVDNGDNNPQELVVSTLEDENDGDFSAGDLSLREAIALASVSDGADTITFDASLSGGTIDFNESLSRDLIISDSVTINGLGQDNLTLDGGFIFKLPETDANLTIDGLNLTGAKIDSFGTLTFSNSTISQTIGLGGVDNSALISRGTTNIIGSTI